MFVCVFVCLFSIKIQTAGRIGMKFGTEVVLKGEGSWGFPKSGSGRTWAPCPSGAMVAHYEGETGL